MRPILTASLGIGSARWKRVLDGTVLLIEHSDAGSSVIGVGPDLSDDTV